MPSPVPPRRPSSTAGFAPVLLANLLPLAGVLWLGWNPETLVAIYGLEVLLAFPLAGAKALFAARPPQEDRESGVISVTSNELVSKRGSVELGERLPPLYLRNVPFASNVVVFAAWMVVFIGVALVAVVPVVDALDGPSALVGVATLFVGRCVETWRGYFRTGRYEEVSPYAVVEMPARRAFFLVFVLFAPPRAGPAAGTLVLAGFVLVKILVEWSGFRAERDGGGRFTGWLSGPDGPTTRPDPPEVPDEEPSAVVRTSRKAVASAAVIETLATHAPFYVPLAAVFGFVVGPLLLGDGAFGTGWLLGGLIAVGWLAFVVAADVVESVLTYGAVEYRRRGNHLVAYDARVEAPQWSAPVDTLRDVELVTDRASDRYWGTRTFTAKTGWGDDETERVLGPVADPDVLVDAFELAVPGADLEPLDRRFVAATGVGVLLVPTAAVVAVATPWAPVDGILYLLFLLPAVALALRGLWRLAYRFG